MERKKQRVRQTRNLAAWTLGWTLSTALVVFGKEFIWEDTHTLTLVALVVNLVLGIGMILANKRLMETFDELERKIHLESMGVTLGLTLVVGLAYSMLDTTNLIPWDAEISFLVIFMGISYLVAVYLNNRRYR